MVFTFRNALENAFIRTTGCARCLIETNASYSPGFGHVKPTVIKIETIGTIKIPHQHDLPIRQAITIGVTPEQADLPKSWLADEQITGIGQA